MGGFKEVYTFELNEDVVMWLKAMTEQYQLADEDKTLRIILDYVRHETDHDEVFEEIRCNHCG